MRALLIIQLFLPLSVAANSGEVYSVCTLLRDPEALGGKMIKVRGIYHPSREGVGIVDANCRHQRVVVNGQEWSPGLAITTPGDRQPRRLKERVEFDEKAFDELVRASHRARAAPNGAVEATFEGLLEYCPIRVKLKNGDTIWFGCGFIGKDLFQLVIKTVSDIAPVQVPPGNR